MYALPAIVTALSIILYLALTFAVGQARGKHNVKAPAITGHDMFERIHRVQINTLEQLVAFIPALWLFAFFLEAPQWASGLGAVWIAGRLIYARAYRLEPKKRMVGFFLTIMPTSILLLGGLIGSAGQLMH